MSTRNGGGPPPRPGLRRQTMGGVPLNVPPKSSSSGAGGTPKNNGRRQSIGRDESAGVKDSTNRDAATPSGESKQVRRVPRSRQSMLPRIDSGTALLSTSTTNARMGGTPTRAPRPPPSGRENQLYVEKAKPGASSSMIPPPSPSHMAATNASRRRSVGGAKLVADRRQSTLNDPSLPPLPAKAQGPGMQEIRPITDKTFQRDAAQAVYNYLESHQYPYHYGLKMLLLPGGREFNKIVTFLLRQFDPQFHSDDSGMKFEEEVAVYFKEMGYPITMSRSGIATSSSSHAWPALLAALSWLVHHLTAMEAQTDVDYLRDVVPYPSEGRLVEHIAKAEAAVFSQYSQEMYLYQQADRPDLLEALDKDLVAAFERGDEVAATELETLERERDGIGQSIERMVEFHKELQDLVKTREEHIESVDQFHDLISKMDMNKLASEKHVQDLTHKLEAANAEVKSIQDEIQEVRDTVDRQTMTVQDELKLVSHSKELSEAIERAEAKKSGIKAELDKETQELENLRRRSEVVFQSCFQSKLSALQDRLPAELPSSQAIAKWKKLVVGDLVGNPSILDEVKSMIVVGQEALEKHLKNLQESHQDILDRLEQLQQVTQASKAKCQYWDDKTAKVVAVLEQETQTHLAKLEVRLIETRLLEQKIEQLQDPKAVETQLAAYERQCGELEAMKSRNQMENVQRIQNVENEIVAAVDMMIQHDAFVAAKLQELHQYNQSKLSKAPTLQHPPGWYASSRDGVDGGNDDETTAAGTFDGDELSLGSSARKETGSTRKGGRRKQQKKTKNSRRK